MDEMLQKEEKVQEGAVPKIHQRSLKSRNVRKCQRMKKRKDRSRGEAYEPEHHEEREKK